MTKTFRNLEDAQAYLENEGGWLLDLGFVEGHIYMVTDDERIVDDLRGQDFIDGCQHLQYWDETQLL